MGYQSQESQHRQKSVFHEEWKVRGLSRLESFPKPLWLEPEITLGLTMCPNKSTGDKPGGWGGDLKMDSGQFHNFLLFVIYKQQQR